MTCRRTLQLSDELLSCRLREGHGGYHEDQAGLPFGPWAEHDGTPLADRPLPTTVPAWPQPTVRCPGCDCDPVGYAPHNGKGDCPPIHPNGGL